MRVELRHYRDRLAGTPLLRQVGRVEQLAGLAVEASGLQAEVGQMCAIGRPQPVEAERQLLAEVVAVHGERLTLMPYGSLHGLRAGCEVEALPTRAEVAAGPPLLGRIVDAFSQPLDGMPPPQGCVLRPLRAAPLNPMQRPRIQRPVETGIRAIDALLTLGAGQRVGIFAGSGVGKSTLLGMVARHVKADVNVIALIGERGREVREFVDKQLGSQGLSRSVVIAAASDQPALVRLRAAHAALAIAEDFRERGLHVMFTMDSVTRYAMARREVGLAAGEPPTARGYTPSVFADLPALCERCGTAPGGGSITALMTVLVEGDDLNEPISDCMRAILDGHVVLSRQLAQAGHYPAIDVLHSASRVMADIVPPRQRQLAAEAVGLLALLERNRQIVEIGGYAAGSNKELDHALSLQPKLRDWSCQREGGIPASQSIALLGEIVKEGRRDGVH